MKRLIVALCAVVSLFAQDGSPVNPSSGPPPSGWTIVYDYDGSGNLIYLGYARSNQNQYSYSVAAGNLTSIVVSSNTATVTATAHGLSVGNKITVSGSATTALNGDYKVLTVADANTFTFTTSGVSNNTYTDATISTTAPRTTAGQWFIYRYALDGSSRVVAIQCSNGGTGPVAIWANRATTVTYQ